MSVVNAVAENKIVGKADSTKALGTHPSNTSLLPEPKPHATQQQIELNFG